jgi:hypothetical protein
MLRHARIAIASLLLLGCGSSSSNPRDASGNGGSGIGGFSGTGGPGAGAGGTGGTGNLGGSGSGNTGGATPTGLLVFQGQSPSLLTQGRPCTWEEGATGDRWCAFTAASVSAPGSTELFAVNVTKAAAGVSITCGQTDANCLKLTSSFFDDPEGLHPALFSGDTLVYYDVAGTPFGWRPGMTAGRALAVADPTTRDVLLCVPDVKGTAVSCLRDLPSSMQTNPQILLSDLLAGRIDDAANPPLARLETVIAASAADTNIVHFQAGFPVPGGNTFAWSARSAAGGPEVLKAQTLGNDASRVTVASNVNSWRASADGARWYWLSQVSETTRAGTLQSAPFPGGASPTTIASGNVLQYEMPTPTTMITVDTTRQLLAYADPAGAPTASTPLDTGVIGLVQLSAQGHVAYAKAVLNVGQSAYVSMFVKKVDGTGACTISSATEAAVSDVYFTPSASGVAWVRRMLSAFPGRFTRLSDCMAMDVAANVTWIEPAGDSGLVTWENFSTASRTGALLFRRFAGAGTVSGDPPALVSGLVRTFWLVSSAGAAGGDAGVAAGAEAAIYTVNGGGSEDGVYVRSFAP